ncbi:hydrogenase nickel incorporation protein [Escherichia coli]|uniref:Hydrogenase nickel incorporation protein n=1 Tax=Escherichia coli TaxID=562 RepID=A0A377C3T2_ECOLX|nr:hydrogenase nickel incorporation protein [Escherichia coli]
MHEITLCQRALELIEQQAAKHGAKRVTGVWLKNWRIFLCRNQLSCLLF